MIAAGAVYFLLAATIIGAFTDDRGVIAGRWRDDGAGLSLPFWAYQSVFGGALRALGDAARTPMLTNIAATWLGVGLAWAGVLALDASLTFAWTAMLITSPIMLLTMPVFRRRLADRRAMIAADMP